MAEAIPVSALVLTLDEAQNIERCLRALDWCDDVVVLDSYSNDATVQQARALGARIFQRQFDDFAAQRNWALDSIDWKHPWVLHLDADEVVTSALVAAITKKVSSSHEYDGFQIPSKLIWDETWLRYSGMYPVYQVRLGRTDSLRFVQVGHGQREAVEARRIGSIAEPYLHYGFSKGLDDWWQRHQGYAKQEAAQSIKDLDSGSFDWKGLLAVNDRTRRRRALKQLSVRLPFRSALRFLYMYILRRGFLDGKKGYRYCRLLARYEGEIVRNIRAARDDLHNRNDLSMARPDEKRSGTSL